MPEGFFLPCGADYKPKGEQTMSQVVYEFKSAVVQATRKFVEREYTPDGDLGDLSMRDPETGYIYILPNQGDNIDIPDWSVITEDQVVVTDGDGNIIESKNGVVPTCEAPMHYAIYKARPDCNAIVHNHSIWSSVFAITGQDIPLALSEFRLFGDSIKCPKVYGKAGSDILAQGVVEALGQNNKAALVRSHGAVSIGRSFREAFSVAQRVEKLAQTVVFGTMIGTVQDIADEYK